MDERPAVSQAGIGIFLRDADADSDGFCVIEEIFGGGALDTAGYARWNHEIHKVKVGDLLLRVDDVCCHNMPRDEIKRHVIGTEGSTVLLSFASRPGNERITMPVRRAALPPHPDVSVQGARYIEKARTRDTENNGGHAGDRHEEHLKVTSNKPPGFCTEMNKRILRIYDAKELSDFIWAHGMHFNHVNIATALRQVLTSRGSIAAQARAHTLEKLEAFALQSMFDFQSRGVSGTLHIMAKQGYRATGRTVYVTLSMCMVLCPRCTQYTSNTEVPVCTMQPICAT
jgi:hypothetical protein